MNRRAFLSSLALGSLSVLGGTALSRNLSANKQGGRVDWSYLDCQTGNRTVYTFIKGPKYRNLKQAFPHMEMIVEKCNGWHRNTDDNLADEIVMLESVTFGRV